MTSKASSSDFGNWGEHFRWKEGERKGSGRGGTEEVPRVAEVAPSTPPRSSPRAPSFPLGLAEMSHGSEPAAEPPELSGRHCWLGPISALSCPAPPLPLICPWAVTVATQRCRVPARHALGAPACPSETRPLPPLRLDPPREPRRGPNRRQHRRHRLRCVPSSAKDRPRSGTPIDF